MGQEQIRSDLAVEKNLASDADIDIAYTSETPTEPNAFDSQGTKRLLRKLDWHLIPFLSLIYLSVDDYLFVILAISL